MATSPRPYQQDRKKYGNADDNFKRPRQSVKSNISKRSSLKEKIKLWTTFYRRNTHRFVEHYLEIKLHFFQKIMIYLMGLSDNFVAIAARGISKSFTIGLYACVHAILYPNSIIVIMSATKGQAGLIVKEKIQNELMPMSANLRREIKKIETNQNNTSVSFHNGSRIIVTVAGDGARGLRSTFLIFEEKRLIERHVVEEIARPFLISRTAGYHTGTKYEHMSELREEPKEMSISSAYYKSYNDGYMWSEIVHMTKKMLKGFEEDVYTHSIIAFDYLLSIYHGLKTKKTMDDAKATTDEISFLMEYCNIMYDENESSYFKLNMFRPNQKVSKCFIPFNPIFHKTNGKNKYKCNINRQDGEIRLISCDFAFRKGQSNDNTIMSCIRLIPTTKGYKRELVYMESHNGENSVKQSVRIMQLFEDFDSDYLVMDLQQGGINIYDMLGTVLKDEERDKEHEPFTIMDSIRLYTDLPEPKIKELEERTLTQNAKGVIFPISATLEINDRIATDFKDNLKRGMVDLLIEPDKAEDYLLKNNNEYKSAFERSDSFEKALILNPYNQVNEFINECVNLEYTISSGKVKIDEKNGRKDRYTSVSYGSYFASKIEKDLLRDTSTEDNFDAWANVLGF